MYIANLRVTYKNAPHDVLDRLAMNDGQLQEFYEGLLRQDNVAEAVVLQTCNRFEVYYSGKDEGPGRAAARKYALDKFGAHIANYLVSDSYLDTLNHLFRVVSSVDSMIVGENQIHSQVKEALDYAMSRKYSGRVLEPVFQKTIAVGKRVRTETKISDGKVSIPSAAVDLANKHNPVAGKSIMLVGTGAMAHLLADYLKGFEAKSLGVVGRNQARLMGFCEQYHGKPLPIDSFLDEICNYDIVFSATACPRVLIPKESIEKAACDRSQPLTLIDIAMPSDIDPSVTELPNVQYFSIDDLKEISESNIKAREQEVEKAKEIIDTELQRMKARLENLHIETFLSPLTLYIDEIRQRELEKALASLDESDPRTAEVIDKFSKSLTKKIMHNFLNEIRQSPSSAEEMGRFVTIFTGNGDLSGLTGHPGSIPVEGMSRGHPSHIPKGAPRGHPDSLPKEDAGSPEGEAVQGGHPSSIPIGGGMNKKSEDEDVSSSSDEKAEE